PPPGSARPWPRSTGAPKRKGSPGSRQPSASPARGSASREGEKRNVRVKQVAQSEPPCRPRGVLPSSTSASWASFEALRATASSVTRSVEASRRVGRGAAVGRADTVASLRIATWNVNSGQPRGPGLLPWLDQRRPDVVCLQETKLADDAFLDLLGDELQDRGYAVAVHGEATWNGVAIA